MVIPNVLLIGIHYYTLLQNKPIMSIYTLYPYKTKLKKSKLILHNHLSTSNYTNNKKNILCITENLISSLQRLLTYKQRKLSPLSTTDRN